MIESIVVACFSAAIAYIINKMEDIGDRLEETRERVIRIELRQEKRGNPENW